MYKKILLALDLEGVNNVCGVPYETALEEIYYSRALAEAQGLNRSAAQEAIRRLGAR